MRFKKLELLGFKSFAEATELVFEPGVTAIVGPNGSGKCLAGSERVVLSDGRQVSIGELVETALRSSAQVFPLEDGFCAAGNPSSISILSLNPSTFKLEPRPVSAFIKRTAPDSLLRIQTHSGREVVATPYHPLFTLQNGSLHALRADEVQVGTRIAVPRRLPIGGAHRRQDFRGVLSRFRPEDRIYVPYSEQLRRFILQESRKHGGVLHLERKYGLPKDSLRGVWSSQSVAAWALARVMEGGGSPWPESQAWVPLKSKGTGEIRLSLAMTEETARFLGYVVSEGRVTPSAQVWFVNSDPALVEDFKHCAQTSFGVQAKVFSYKKGASDVIIFSQALCLALDRIYGLRMEAPSSAKRIPEQILTAPKEVVAHFLSALLEGDGHLCDRGRTQYIEYTTASERLARDLVGLLLRFGITASLRPKLKSASNTRRRIKRLYYSVYIYGVGQLRALAGILRFAGDKRHTLRRYGTLAVRSNPNHDLIPGLRPLIRSLTRTSRVRVKHLRKDSPRLAAYHEGRCEASRVGVAEVLDLAARYGSPTSESVAVSTRLKQLADSDLLWDQIAAVEVVAPETPWVYDLSVDETHNFVAENIIVHNSNVADAIKWVLGEQSARELRGGRMEDLIFSGSERRDPLNYAQVALTLDNSDQKLPIPYSEVTIARRLFRSGESEYLINKNPVRLKDIQQLLMGTGIGTSAYSLFEQGRIEQIITARPEDRRQVFEEAAGITRFKAQKREALRKLDQTEENLARVTDVIAEVARQIRSIERQVQKARSYREQMETLKTLELRLARGEVRQLKESWAQKEAALNALKEDLSALETQARDQESAFQAVRDEDTQAADVCRRVQEEALRLDHERQALEQRRQVLGERIAEGAARGEQLRREKADADRHLEEILAQQEELKRSIDGQEEERRRKQEKIAQERSVLEACDLRIAQAEAAIRTIRERLLEAAQLHVQAKNGFTHAQQEFSRSEARLNRLYAERAKVAGEMEEAGTKLNGVDEELRRGKQAREALEAERPGLKNRLEEAETALSRVTEEADALEEEKTRFSSQCELLKGLLVAHEGYSGGVKTLLTAMDEGQLSREGVLGVLAELLQVAQAEAPALEAALGEWAQAVVVESFAQAERCRRFLSERQAGRVLFLILDRIREGSWIAGPAQAIPEAQPLAERVGVTPHLEKLLKLLLADVWFVPDRETALSILDQRSGSDRLLRLVTPSGELLTPASALLGCEPAEGTRVIGRMDRLKSLEAALSRTESRLEEILTHLQSAREHCRLERRAAADWEERAAAAREALKEIEARRESASESLESIRQEQALLESETAEADVELRAARQRLENRRREEEEKAQALEALEQSVQAHQQEIAEVRRRKEGAAVAVAGAQAELASFEEVCAGRVRSMELLERAVCSSRDQIEARRIEIERLDAQRAECEEEIRAAETALGELETRLEGARNRLREAEDRQARARQAAEAQQERFLGVRRRLDEIRRQVHSQEMERTQMTFREQQIADRLWQIYQIRMTETPPEENSPVPEGRQALEGLRSEVRALEERLKKMGPVNLASIDEEQELNSRHEYLTRQQTDLIRAKDDLHTAITRINRTTRAMFRETFEAVQKEFQVCFRRLFGGGEARLILMDEEDVLESGVEIIARPPGKQLQTISLLSGGEKALTTIALLFAIFRIKPSPFCVLDEIDAPLDEANITRFASSLREFLQESQFIIITHNKKTISMADLMYGVTMAERGVSRLVSVRLNADGNGNGNGHSGPAPDGFGGTAVNGNGNGHKETSPSPTKSRPE